MEAVPTEGITLTVLVADMAAVVLYLCHLATVLLLDDAAGPAYT